jgi:K(+)-stimulated pyrophosphate-energized sodium pump
MIVALAVCAVLIIGAIVYSKTGGFKKNKSMQGERIAA